jgi:hypothetical protein
MIFWEIPFDIHTSRKKEKYPGDEGVENSI